MKDKELIKAVRDVEASSRVERTALAVAKYEAWSSESSKLEEIDSHILGEESSSAPSGENNWTRHDFLESELQVYTRGDGEVLSIRKAPEGEGWLIVYGQPSEDRPS